MSEILNTTEGAQNKYPTDYIIDEISLIISVVPQPIQLKPFMVELNYYEDIFNNTISGQLLLSDAIGMLSTYRLNGTEFIKFKLRKNKDSDAIQGTFRVYKVSNAKYSANYQYQNYVLHFCSEEYLLSEQYRISKSCKGQEISTIIKNIVSDDLKIRKKVFIEETIGIYDFVLPNKKIFETINWLTKYATSAKNQNGADMLFFENIDGYWFKSLQTLYQQKSSDTYYYNPKNISEDFNDKVKNIMDFEIMDSFDILGGISKGSFHNKVITLDPLLREANTTNYNYSNYFNKSKTLNGNPVINNYTNRLGETLYQTPSNERQSGPLRMVITNKDQIKNNYVAQKVEQIQHDFFVEKYLPNRVAQLNLSNYSRVKITIPGNPSMSVGMTINVNVYSVAPTTYTGTNKDTKAERTLDIHHSGKYLISAVRHIVKNTSYITVMELIKDSFSTQLYEFNDNVMSGVK